MNFFLLSLIGNKTINTLNLDYPFLSFQPQSNRKKKMSDFIPEHLREEPPMAAPKYSMHPKREEMNRLAPLTRYQFSRALGFVQRKGIGYAIKEGFVNGENPFAVRSVILPTNSEKCLFEFDPNAEMHIATQLGTSVEQALGDSENGRVELFSTKHGKYLQDLSHGTILSDINFAKDVVIERRPDQPMRDPAALVGALANSKKVPTQVDEADQFAREISNNIGAQVAHFVVVQNSPGSWGDSACKLAKNRLAVKRCVLRSVMCHPRYGGRNFCSHARRFGCRPQFMVNTLSTLLSHSLCTEAAMSSFSHCGDPAKLRCTLSKRVSEAMRCGLLGWMRACALRCRKNLRDKACYRDVDEDECGLRKARSSDDESSSDDERCADPYVRRMQSLCGLCHLPLFRCRCNNVYTLPTDCYGRIDAQVVSPQNIACGVCGGKKKKKAHKGGVSQSIGCSTCGGKGKKKGHATALVSGKGKKKGLLKQQARSGDEIVSDFEAALKSGDSEAMDSLIEEAKVGNSFGDMWAKLKHHNPFRRRCGPCDDTSKEAADWSNNGLAKRTELQPVESAEQTEDFMGNEESETESETENDLNNNQNEDTENASDFDGEEVVNDASDFDGEKNELESETDEELANREESGPESEAEEDFANEEESGPESEAEEDFDSIPPPLDRDTVTVDSVNGPINMTRGEFEKLREQGVVSTEGGRRTSVYTQRQINAKLFEVGKKNTKKMLKKTEEGAKEKKAKKAKKAKKVKKDKKPQVAASSSASFKTFSDAEGKPVITVDKKGMVQSRYLVDNMNEPESVKVFDALWKRGASRIASSVNPSGDAMNSYVFMAHDAHPNLKDVLSLSKKGSNEPIYDYLRSVSIEVPKGTKLAAISSKLSVDGKNTFSVTSGGFAINDMPIGFDMKEYGNGNIYVVPSSFIVSQK